MHHSALPRPSLICFLGGLFWVLVSASTATAELITYHIGNSLTAGLLGPDYNTRLRPLTQAEGANAIVNRQDVRSNHGLTDFVTQPIPTGSTRTHYPDVFANERVDVLILQPWSGNQRATLRAEAASAAELIRQFRLNPANALARILIYETWGPNTDTKPFLNEWTRGDARLDEMFFPSETTTNIFMAELARSVPEAELIPAGAVFAAIAQRFKTEEGLLGLPEFHDLYSDAVHPSNAGAYAAALTTYAVLYGKSPVGLGYPQQMLDPVWGYVLPQAGREPMQSLVAEVVGVPEPSVSLVCAVLALAAAFIAREQSGTCQ